MWRRPLSCVAYCHRAKRQTGGLVCSVQPLPHSRWDFSTHPAETHPDQLEQTLIIVAMSHSVTYANCGRFLNDQDTPTCPGCNIQIPGRGYSSGVLCCLVCSTGDRIVFFPLHPGCCQSDSSRFNKQRRNTKVSTSKYKKWPKHTQKKKNKAVVDF